MTQSADTEGWDRFLHYAAHARTKPSFDAEEREYRLDVADRLGGFLSAAREGSALEPGVRTVFDGFFGSRMYELTLAGQNHWLFEWARLDELSLRTALAKFLAPDQTAQARFEAFATVAAQAQPADRVAPHARLVVAFGSLFNFAVEPLALPVIRLARYQRLRVALGEAPPSGLSLAEQYRGQVAFAKLVQRRLEAAGAPVRDMIDVQSLIWSADEYMDSWEPGARIGPPGRTQGKPAMNERKAGPAGGESGERAYLSICAIYRDEAEFMGEWIEFHRLAGVERFFLYDNLSADSHLEVLAPYVEDGTVVLHHWPIAARAQNQAYDNCLALHGDESRWIAFIDLDEFLYSPTGITVAELLREYEGWPGVAVNGAQYGFSGHRTKPQGLVIENYVERVHLQAMRFVKSIVDPRQTSHCFDPHHCIYHRGLAVDENGHPVFGATTTFVSVEQLRINHYWTKSEEEFRRKCAMPEASVGHYRPWPHWDSFRRNFSEVTDRALQAYVPRVREALERTNARRPAKLPTVVQAPPDPVAKDPVAPATPTAPVGTAPSLPAESLAEQATRFEHLALRGHLALLLSRLNVNCMLDVGAFDGGYARDLRAAGYEGWIVSLEPVGTTYDRLSEAAKDDPRWRTLRVALGSNSETRSINVAGNAVLSSFLPHSRYALDELGPMTDTVEREQVAVRRLDELIDECLDGISEPRVFLKIDTQGWDLEVLKGAADTLPAVLAVQTELSLKPIYEGMPGYLETIGHLQGLGFELTGTYPVVRDRSMRMMEVDCVLVRAAAIGT